MDSGSGVAGDPLEERAHEIEVVDLGSENASDANDEVDTEDEEGVDGSQGEPASDDDSDSGGEELDPVGEDYRPLKLKDDQLPKQSGEDMCTLVEALRYRKMLRELGPRQFIELTVNNGSISARKLLTAFRIKVPRYLEDERDEEIFPLLIHALDRALNMRDKLEAYNSPEDVVALLKKCNNIMVLTGAGISTSLGIPDFRSPHTGLYSKLARFGLDDPQDVFNIERFNENPHIFFEVAKDILPGIKRFSPTHKFIQLLHHHGKLLTNYTQNIDGLEKFAGIPDEKVVHCHGSFATATCVKCKVTVPGESIFEDIKAGIIPRCKACVLSMATDLEAVGMKRKKSINSSNKRRKRGTGDWLDSDDEDDEDDDIPEPGIMKPDITFFGEALPDKFGNRLKNHDRALVDLVIIIGTTLKVAPVSNVVPFLPPHVPQIYISREAVNHFDFDVDMLGECDVIVTELCRRAGWELKHEMIPEDQRVDVKQVEGYSSRYVFEVMSNQTVPTNGTV